MPQLMGYNENNNALVEALLQDLSRPKQQESAQNTNSLLSALSDIIFPKAYAHPSESYYQPAMERTKQFEGWEPTPYLDTKGNKTIGWGFNQKANPGIPNNLTFETAQPYMDKFYKQADAKAMQFAGKRWSELTDSQKAVLTDMAYNLNDKLFDFERMQKNLMAGNNAGVQREMKDSDWYKQVKSRGVKNVADWSK